MLRSILRSVLELRFLVVVVAAALVAFGVTRLRAMPVTILPEFSAPYVEIQTEALGLSAKEVEQMITTPMEQDLLAGVAWLDVIRSESVAGMSSVVVYFEPGTDLFRARQMVSERLAQAAVGLPHVSKSPTMIQPLSSDSRFMIVGLSSQDLSLIDMSVLARWVIVPRMLGVTGVSNVSVWGMRDRQLQVLVDPAQLQAQQVSLQQVVETTGNALWVSSLSYLEASTPGTGGFIDTPNQRLGVWHVLPISSPEQLGQVPLEGREEMRLSDVAQVVEDHQPLIGDAIVNDSPGLLLVIEKLPGVNTLEVSRGVEQAIEVLQPGMQGITFDATLFRPASYIEMAVSDLTNAVVIGAVLIVITLLGLLWNWRVALISIIVIPLSLVSALIVLAQSGATLNSLVFAGLVVAIGMIIDDAIVDVDHVVRRLRQRLTEGTQAANTNIMIEATSEMRGSAIFATLIMVLLVLPVLFVEGVSGTLMQTLVGAYVVAMIVSLVVAVLVTPALSLILLSGTSSEALERRQSPLITSVQRSYDRVLAQIMPQARWAYAAVGVLIVLALAPLPLLERGSLLPTFKEPQLTIELESAPGTSRPEMDRIVARASEELRGLPGVQNVGAHVGRAVLGDQVVDINSAELWVSIDPNSNYDETVAAVRETIGGYVGLSSWVRTYSGQALNEPRTSGNDGMAVRVYGEDQTVLRTEADKAQQAISGINGVANAHVVIPPEQATLEIEVNLASAQTHGIKPGDVRRAAATLLSGLQVGSLFQEQKIFDVVVWGTPETRTSVTDVQNLLIETPIGEYVRLGDMADVRIVSTPTLIRRDAISPYLDVAFDADGRDVIAVINDVEAALRDIPFELEYHATVVSDLPAQQATQQRILLYAAIAVVGIFLLLQAAFESWTLALVAVLTTPLALAGGVVAVLISGGVVSLGSLFGFLLVLGITIRHNIDLSRQFRNLEQHRGLTFDSALAERGAHERFVPVLVTNLVTALALLPLLLLGDLPGFEIVRPMAFVIVGGLITSTAFSLFVVPVLYLRFGAQRQPLMDFEPVPAPVAA